VLVMSLLARFRWRLGRSRMGDFIDGDDGGWNVDLCWKSARGMRG
jgi:hypothetical protein